LGLAALRPAKAALGFLGLAGAVLLVLGPSVVVPAALGAPPSPACPKVLVCGPGVDAEGVCDLGTTFSTLVCPRTCRSVMAALGGGGVAPPDSSSSLCVDAELYKSITSYKSDDIDHLCYTHTNSR
jgi:hypothetical protein